MSVSFWQDRSTGEVVNIDVAIVGGGIAGLSTAFWLNKEDPTLKIAIIEKSLIGAGATGRNAGFVTCGSVEHFNRMTSKHGVDETLEIWRFSETNLALLQEHIIQDKRAQLGFETNGSFSLASTREEFSELKKSAELMKSMNIAVEVLEEQEIISRLGAHDFVGGIKYCGDASIHPMKLLMALKDILEKTGQVKFYENNEVYDIETVGGQKLVKTNLNRFQSDLLVMATNGYSPLLHSFFEDKIFPTRGQILATSPVPRFMEGPCYANFVLDYFRQLPTGELIIGGFRQLQKDAEIGYSDQTSDVIQMALEKFLHRHIPKIKDAKINYRWSGIMGFSVDGQPMVGSLPSDPQTFFLGGFTAHGLGLGFHTGKVLVDAIFDREIPRFISAKRF